MHSPRRLAGLLALAGGALAGVSLPALLGVLPNDAAKYSGAKFACFDGSGGELPASAVNDFYCDCADGSDEPGTGACAGQERTVFFCANKGSTARTLYASRVGDGICDCCDGSDEAALAAVRSFIKPCPDVCAEQGAREKAEMQRRVDSLKRGVAERERIAAQAVKDRAQWEEEVKKLQSELPALEKVLEEAKAAAAEAKAAADAERQKAAEEAKVCSETCMWRQTGGCDPSGPREEGNDKKCNETIPWDSSGFCDCDGDGKKGDLEAGFDCGGSERKCCQLCKKLQEDQEKGEAAAPKDADAPKEEKVVSEYTKWMDGAEKAMEKKDDGKEDKVVSEYTKWMDGAEKAMGDAKESCQYATEKTGWYGGKVLEERTTLSKEACRSACCKSAKCQIFVFREKDSMCIMKDRDAPQFNDEVGHITAIKVPSDMAGAKTEADKASDKTAEQKTADEERTARSAVTKNKDETRKIQSKIDALSDDHLGYASLAGKTLSKHIGEFDYKVSFFADAKQGYTSLGRWDKWTGKKSALFSGGTTCWSGPARQLDVKFQCGIEEALEDVSEPSRCVYEAVITHPGACDPEELESLVAGDRIVGPRDEL